MNKRRLVSIAKWLEAGAPHKKGVDGFCMAEFEISAREARLFGGKTTITCGTVCCIAGAANQFFHPRQNGVDEFDTRSRDDDELYYWPLAQRAAKVLDLEPSVAYDLFGIDNPQHIFKATPAIAARCIRNLIATGEVDWKKAKRG